jgi:hypothetical protein
LDGINLLESLVNDLVRAGLGTLNAKSARQIEEQARQLGNACLPGAQECPSCSDRNVLSLANQLRG